MGSLFARHKSGKIRSGGKKVLTPGIEPGLSKPQSDVLPLYYVSLQYIRTERIDKVSGHMEKENRKKGSAQVGENQVGWKRGNFNGMIITHEVIDIEKDASGKYIFHTKGLTNIVEDPIVEYSQVYGKIVRKSAILSFIYMIVGSKYGIFLFIIIPLFYIIGSEILSFLLEKEEKRRNA